MWKAGGGVGHEGDELGVMRDVSRIGAITRRAHGRGVSGAGTPFGPLVGLPVGRVGCGCHGGTC